VVCDLGFHGSRGLCVVAISSDVLGGLVGCCVWDGNWVEFVVVGARALE